MQNEIKKNELLNWMATSVWKDLSTKSALYNIYYNRIEALLHELDGDIVIKDLDSLEGLTEKEAFYNFVRESSFEELDKRFFAIAKEVGTWKKHMAEMVKLRGQNVIRHKKGKAGILTVIFLLVAALAGGIILVATALEDNSAINKIAGAILTGLDIILGITFFLYEIISDRKEKEMGERIESAKQSGALDQIINIDNQFNIKKQIVKPKKGDVIFGNKYQLTKRGSDMKGTEDE